MISSHGRACSAPACGAFDALVSMLFNEDVLSVGEGLAPSLALKGRNLNSLAL